MLWFLQGKLAFLCPEGTLYAMALWLQCVDL
jgi:hypothetical protein